VVREKEKSEAEIFPDIFGLSQEKRRILEVLACGKGVLLTGEYGVAKTEITKHIVSLLREYHEKNEVFYVASCPVQEDPLNVAYSMGLIGASEAEGLAEACPICRANYVAKGVDPNEIKVARFSKLVEGRGYARIQSGSDVLPEEIIGTYNLAKLAEIGDPFDPQVFQCGKIGQASGGILFVDELGKLSEAAQYALIQAAQEGTVTPTKSRDTFPVDILLIATTNYIDEEYISGAVLDRLVSIKIPLVSCEDEVRIVGKELTKSRATIHAPKAFVHMAVELVRQLRGSDGIELSPRASINASLIAHSSALFEGKSVVDYCDFKEGIYTSVLGKAKYEDKEEVEKRIDGAFPTVSDCLKGFFPKVDFPGAVAELKTSCGKKDPFDHGYVEQAISQATSFPKVNVLVTHIAERESVSPELLPELVAVYLSAFDRGCVQDG
jgi:MoxR-like ATPase